MIRSLLFAGAMRPDLVAKLPRSGPDACVVDLEDAVPASHKDQARGAVTSLVAGLLAEAGGPAVYVRVNAVPSPWFADDVAAALASGADGIVVPKLDSDAQLAVVAEALSRRGRPDARVIAGIESARGVLSAVSLLQAPVTAAYFGAEDLIADIGGTRTPEGDEVLYARSHVALAARAAGVVAIDQAVVALRDDDRFATDAALGARLGYAGKICVHPRQVELAHACFTPPPDRVAWARRVLAAAEAAAAEGRGAIDVDGEMVDEPALRMARDVVARHPD